MSDSPFAKKTPEERIADAEAFVRDALSHQSPSPELVSDVARKVVKIMHKLTGVRYVRKNTPEIGRTYTCPYPDCGAVSHNVNDLRHRYCDRCKRWAADLP